jgi:hypothetical protein
MRDRGGNCPRLVILDREMRKRTASFTAREVCEPTYIALQ